MRVKMAGDPPHTTGIQEENLKTKNQGTGFFLAD
jgi:hypothetical protein